MDKVTRLLTLLTSLKNISNDIIKKVVPIMKSIDGEKNPYIKMVYKKLASNVNPNPSDLPITEYMQKITLEWISDAEKVKTEIDKFIEFTDEDEYILKLNSKNVPFLMEVWNGDTYDKTGLDGLDALLGDLKSQLNNISSEKLVADTTIHIRTLV